MNQGLHDQRRTPYVRGGYRKVYRIIMSVATSSTRKRSEPMKRNIDDAK